MADTTQLQQAHVAGAKTATITTAVVEIRILSISAKQMTLCVFRQLPTALAYHDDGSLRADFEHWGRVRYEVKNAGDHWLVATHDGQLYRCLIWPRNQYNTAPLFPSVKFVEAELARANQHNDGVTAYRQALAEYEALDRAYVAEGHTLAADAPRRQSQYFPEGYPDENWIRAHRTLEQPTRPNPHSFFGKGKDEVWPTDEILAGLLIARRAAASYAQLSKLPQLFIAV